MSIACFGSFRKQGGRWVHTKKSVQCYLCEPRTLTSESNQEQDALKEKRNGNGFSPEI